MKYKKKIDRVLIKSDYTLRFAIQRMNKFGLKSLVVVDKNDNFIGVLSNGDIRRAISRKIRIDTKLIKLCNKKAIYFYEDNLKLIKAKKLIIRKDIDLLPILNKSKKIIKIIFEKDFTKKNKIKINKKKIPLVNVMIMSGGKGTRLQPYTSVLPKPLLPYKGKPLIEHVIKNFMKYKIKNFTCSLHYQSHLIKAFFKERKLPINLNYLEEKKPLGTAGSLKMLKGMNRNFIVTNCDTLINYDLNKILKFHKKNSNDLTVICAKMPIQIPYGVCEIDSKNVLNKINEKPKNVYLASVGTYMLNSKLISLIPKKDTVYNMTDLINDAKIRQKKVGVFVIPKKSWLDLGTIKSLTISK